MVMEIKINPLNKIRRLDKKIDELRIKRDIPRIINKSRDAICEELTDTILKRNELLLVAKLSNHSGFNFLDYEHTKKDRIYPEVKQ
jgi:hypothetical protein